MKEQRKKSETLEEYGAIRRILCLRWDTLKLFSDRVMTYEWVVKSI